MALSIAQPPKNGSVATIATSATTGASSAFTIPFADAYTFYLNITTAGQTTTDVVFQTSVDGGTTYVNVPWRFAQVTTVTGCYVLDVHAGPGPGYEAGTVTTGNGALTAATGGALALQSVVDPRYMKIGYTISGTSPGATLYCMAWPRGARGTFDE